MNWIELNKFVFVGADNDLIKIYFRFISYFCRIRKSKLIKSLDKFVANKRLIGISQYDIILYMQREWGTLCAYDKPQQIYAINFWPIAISFVCQQCSDEPD